MRYSKKADHNFFAYFTIQELDIVIFSAIQ